MSCAGGWSGGSRRAAPGIVGVDVSDVGDSPSRWLARRPISLLTPLNRTAPRCACRQPHSPRAWPPLVLDAMAEDGVYHSQFVTGTSNGGLTAHPGGDRWRWESRIFGGAYDEATAHERPVYGALNFRRQPVGAAPRFGSAHFRLTAQALTRTTFCYPDSFLEPSDFGVAARMGLIELALADRQDDLDDYIEAQVHGPVQLHLPCGGAGPGPLLPRHDGRGRGPASLAARWSGTLASGSASRNSDVTPATAVRSTSTWARRSRSTACSILGSSETPHVPASMTPRPSRRCGTASHRCWASPRAGGEYIHRWSRHLDADDARVVVGVGPAVREQTVERRSRVGGGAAAVVSSWARES